MNLPPPLVTDDQNVWLLFVCFCCLFIRAVHRVDRESAQQVKAPHEENRQHDEWDGDAADGDPALSTGDVNGRMLVQGSATPEECDGEEDPHHDGDHKEADGLEPLK